jgi:hypothetical protein
MRRWEHPDLAEAGRWYGSLEELDIAAGPRPIKSAALLAAELAGRRSRADTKEHPHDRIPLRITTLEHGVPTLTEAMTRYLCGQRGRSLEERRMALLLLDLARQRPVIAAWLVERYEHGASYAQIAATTSVSSKTVARIILRETLALLASYQALYGYAPAQIVRIWGGVPQES